MLQDEAFLAIYNCGVHRNVAEAVIANIDDKKLKEAVTSPSWALFNYWKSMYPNFQEEGCETGEELAAALKKFGFREDIVNKLPGTKKFGHLSARGWARHIAQDVYNSRFA